MLRSVESQRSSDLILKQFFKGGPVSKRNWIVEVKLNPELDEAIAIILSQDWEAAETNGRIRFSETTRF
jgi:hypothetical protein